jgi:WXG100 family type VII secretion target
MYGDGQLLVNVGRLRETGDHIQMVVSSLRSQLSGLEAEARPLVASWSGPAREAYEERQNTWRAASNDLVSILSRIRQALDESATDYEDAERRNASLFR